MNCHSIGRLLRLEDDDARVDRAALRAHFRSCGFCRRAFPEVFALAAAQDERVAPPPAFVPSGRPRWHEAAAAALLSAAIGLAALTPDAGAPRATPAPPHAPLAQAVDHSLAVTRTEWIGGRPFTSRLERETVHLNPARTAR